MNKNKLPIELWLQIFQYFDLIKLNSIASISKEFYALTNLEKQIRLLHYQNSINSLELKSNQDPSSLWLENSRLILILSHHVTSGLLTAFRLRCIGFNVGKGSLEFQIDGDSCLGLWISKVGFFSLGPSKDEIISFRPTKPPRFHLFGHPCGLLNAFKYIDDLRGLPSSKPIRDRLGKHTSQLSESLGSVSYTITEYHFDDVSGDLSERLQTEWEDQLVIHASLNTISLNPEKLSF